MAFVNEKEGRDGSKWRTVDYEREAVLKRVDGIPYGGGDRFELRWKTAIVKFDGYYKGTSNSNGNYEELFWNLNFFRCSELIEKKEELKKLICDALSVYGFLYDSRDIKNTHIHFETFI